MSFLKPRGHFFKLNVLQILEVLFGRKVYCKCQSITLGIALYCTLLDSDYIRYHSEVSDSKNKINVMYHYRCMLYMTCYIEITFVIIERCLDSYNRTSQ